MAECPLDLRPAGGEVRIILRQLQQAMEMIGQEHDRYHLKSPRASDDPEGLAQQGASSAVGEQRSTMMGHQRKEEHPARLKSASVFGHEM
jgi:hypothetical protein